MTPLVVFGAGELARLLNAFLAAAGHPPVACTVDAEHVATAHLGDLPVVAWDDLPARFPPSDFDLLVAVGYRGVNRGRARIADRALEAGYRLATYSHPSAIIAPDVALQPNTILFERVVIQPFVDLGSDVVIWSGATVAHDSTIGDHCFLAPEATIAGNVTLGAYSFVGANATVRDGITIGEGSIIGAGAVVKSNLAAGTVLSAAQTPPGTRRASDYDGI